MAKLRADQEAPVFTHDHGSAQSRPAGPQLPLFMPIQQPAIPDVLLSQLPADESTTPDMKYGGHFMLVSIHSIYLTKIIGKWYV